MAWADMLVEMLSRSFLGEAEGDVRSGGLRTPVKGTGKEDVRVHLNESKDLRSDGPVAGRIGPARTGMKRTREALEEEDMELDGEICYTSTPIGSPLAGVKAGYGSDDGYEGDVSMSNIGMGGVSYPVSSPLTGMWSRWTCDREAEGAGIPKSPYTIPCQRRQKQKAARALLRGSHW